MSNESWIAITIAFVLGAMSPGPSLSIVLRNTLVKGKTNGVLTGLGHGFGFSLFSLTVLISFSNLLNYFPKTEIFLRYAGVLLLLYLFFIFAKKALDKKELNLSNEITSYDSNRIGFIQGFFVAILNPKILAWMIAIYTPFIKNDLDFFTVILIVILGFTIDAGWYISVATLVGNNDEKITKKISSRSIDFVMTILMLFFALIMLTDFL